MTRNNLKSKKKNEKKVPTKAAKKVAKKAAKKAEKAKSSAKKPAKTSDKSLTPPRRAYEALGIITLAIAVLLGPSLVSVQFGDGKLMGPMGQTLGFALNWTLGFSGYLFILALIVISIRIFASGLGIGRYRESMQTLWRERVGLLLAICFISIILHLLFRQHRIAGASPGGLFGAFIAEIFCSIVSTPGAWVISIAGLTLSVVLTTNMSWAETAIKLWQLIGKLRVHLNQAMQHGADNMKNYIQSLAELVRRQTLTAEADGTAAMPPPVVRMNIPRETIAEEIMPESQILTHEMPKDLEIEKKEEPVIEKPVIEEPAKVEPAKVETAKAEPAKAEPAKAEPEESAQKEALTIVEPEYDKELDVPDPEEKEASALNNQGYVLNGDTYTPPSLSLLEYDASEKTKIDHDAIFEQAKLLTKTLADYKIIGKVTEVHPGPIVTMYEFVPAPGTRISKIANLADDLAMSLAAQRVRIVAPIPGKGAIGIEVPNETREMVYFKEIVSHKTFQKNNAKLSLALGKNIVGAPVTVDLSKMPHLLVAGATGAGKSVSINSMICSLLLKNSPEDVRMIMVDPKYLELSGYNGIPHLLLPVVTDPAKANTASQARTK